MQSVQTPELSILSYTWEGSVANKHTLAVLRKAASIWNQGFVDLVQLVDMTNQDWRAHITVRMDTKGEVRNADNPDRVALCRRQAPDTWLIMLTPDIRWAWSWWARAVGAGEDALATLVHELGHVFKLPHSENPDHVMHPEIGGDGKPSRKEMASYRQFLLQRLEDEA